MATTHGMIVLDISGSMGTASALGDATTGRSILQLTAAAASAMVTAMTPATAIGVVSFSSSARIEVPLRQVTEGHQALMRSSLQSLQPEGSTHTWAGIETAMNELLPIWRTKEG